jgi:hypothetical protein
LVRLFGKLILAEQFHPQPLCCLSRFVSPLLIASYCSLSHALPSSSLFATRDPLFATPWQLRWCLQTLTVRPAKGLSLSTTTLQPTITHLRRRRSSSVYQKFNLSLQPQTIPHAVLFTFTPIIVDDEAWRRLVEASHRSGRACKRSQVRGCLRHLCRLPL